jgi:hypothetical protein
MSQNLISLSLSNDAWSQIDAALTTLEQQFAGFITLSSEERRTLAKMGDKSEAFCRQTVLVASQNLQLIPASVDVAEAQADLANLDQLRPRLQRLRSLLDRGDDTDMALGSDLYTFSLDAYALLKVAGKGTGLDALRQAMSVRLGRRSQASNPTPAPAR